MSAAGFHGLLDTGKISFFATANNCFYRLVNSERVNWRGLLSIACRFQAIIRKEGAVETNAPCCYIVEDTTIEKTGTRAEGLSRVFDHVLGRCVLGYKLLALALFAEAKNGICGQVADCTLCLMTHTALTLAGALLRVRDARRTLPRGARWTAGRDAVEADARHSGAAARRALPPVIDINLFETAGAARLRHVRRCGTRQSPHPHGATGGRRQGGVTPLTFVWPC